MAYIFIYVLKVRLFLCISFVADPRSVYGIDMLKTFLKGVQSLLRDFLLINDWC